MNVKKDDSDDLSNNSINEECTEVPEISNESYYWIGKDYANTYVADFQNIEEFDKGNYEFDLTCKS